MSNKAKKRVKKPAVLSWFFPVVIICLYILGSYVAPDKTEASFRKSVALLLQVIGPIGLALVTMLLLNRFLSPLLAVKYLGKRTGMKGVLFSSLAGIVSMGPIYAWYPLFSTLREKGASSFHVANFMGCRSIKPVLVPFLVAYFGLFFSTFFLLANFISALVVAWLVGLVTVDGAGEE